VIYLTHPDGHVERRSLGMVTPKFAAAQRTIFQREIAEGRYSKPVPRVERVLFGAIADRAEEHAKNFTRFWDSTSSRIKRMKEWWGTVPADSITKDMIEAKLLENMAPRGLKWCATTWNEYRAPLSRVYELADVGFNPARKVTRHKLDNARTRELSFDEETRLRGAITELYPEKMPELDLALHTGVRRSNLYGTRGSKRRLMEPLQWSAVNLDWKILQLPRSKGGRGYSVPLNSAAMDALKILAARSNGTGAVIRKPSGLEVYSSRKWFEASLKKAAIADFCWHDLRHTFGTRLRRNGTPLEDIAALMGHDLGRNSITARYAHADIERLRAAVDSLVTKTGTKTDTGTVVEFQAVSTA
jgi:integrase